MNSLEFKIVHSTSSRAGCTLSLLAARYGSGLDALLTLYDANGQQVASKDQGDATDLRLELKLPRDGVYYLSLIDAHDTGGPAHVYRLVVQ